MQNAIKQQQSQPYPSSSFNPFAVNQPYPSSSFNPSLSFNPSSPFNPSSFDASLNPESVYPSFITPTTPSQSSSLTAANYSGLMASANVHLHSQYKQTKKKI